MSITACPRNNGARSSCRRDRSAQIDSILAQCRSLSVAPLYGALHLSMPRQPQRSRASHSPPTRRIPAPSGAVPHSFRSPTQGGRVASTTPASRSRSRAKVPEPAYPDQESYGSSPLETIPEPTAANQIPQPSAPTPDQTIADPGPLGLAAFAMTTFVLSVFNAGIISDPKLEAVVLPLAFFYGGGAQVLAGMWEFKKNNTFGATAFTSYGAFWLTFYLLITKIAGGLGANAHQAVGLYLLSWTIFTLYMTVASIRVSGAVLAVFVVLSATFFFLTIGEFAQSTAIHHFAGYLGLLTAVLAWYASFAGVTNSTFKRLVVPTWPARSD
jgi:uncharacterized protein